MDEYNKTAQEQPAHFVWRFPTPVTATFPPHLPPFAEAEPSPTESRSGQSSMAGTKRSSDELNSDDDVSHWSIAGFLPFSGSVSPSEPESLSYSSPVSPADPNTLNIVRRHRHRLYTASRRLGITTPQPAKPPFNIFKTILRHPHLFFEFTKRLPIDTLVDLYAIDKEFHYRFNKCSLSIVHDYVKYHAPVAAEVFTWSMYSKLCISDPSLKPMDARLHLARDIPSLRWAKLVLHRDQVVRQILTLLALEGHRVPCATAKVLMRYWTLMEVNKQSAREAFVGNKEMWTDTDIFLFHMFLMKLDMRFTHPVQGQGITALSHLLLTQKSLHMLCDVLNGSLMMNYDILAQIMISTYPMDQLDTDTHPWMDDFTENGGLEEWEWGLLSKEGWDEQGGPLVSGVDLLRLEGVKRRLHLQQYLLDFVLYGWVDERTGKNIPLPRVWRGDTGKVVVPETGWMTREEKEAAIEKWDAYFGCATKSQRKNDEEVKGGNDQVEEGGPAKASSMQYGMLDDFVNPRAGL